MRNRVFSCLLALGLILLIATAALSRETTSPSFPYGDHWRNNAYLQPGTWLSFHVRTGSAFYVVNNQEFDADLVTASQFTVGANYHVRHWLAFPIDVTSRSRTVGESSMAEGNVSAKLRDTIFSTGLQWSPFYGPYHSIGATARLGLASVSDELKTTEDKFYRDATVVSPGGSLHFIFYPVRVLELGLVIGGDYQLGNQRLGSGNPYIRSGAAASVELQIGVDF